MPAPVGPYTLPAIGSAVTVPVPPGQYTQVVLDNASPYTCSVNIGGPQRWLAAFTSDLYDIAAGATVTVTPSVALTGASTDATLTATFYRSDETPDGTYPVSLTSQAVVAALTGSVAATILGTVPVLAQQALLATIPIVGAASAILTNVPAWCRRLVVVVKGSSIYAPASVIATGAPSGFETIVWTAPGPTTNAQVLLGGSLYGSVDSTVTIGVTMNNSTTGTGTAWVIAVEEDDLFGSPGNPQNEQVTAWEYTDGIVDVAVSAAMPGGLVSEALIPAPPPGFLAKITGLQYQCGATAGYFFVAPAGGTRFKQITVAANACVDVPCSASVATAILGNSSVAGTIYATYKFVPLLR